MDGLNSYLEINLPFFEVAGYDGSDKELVRLFDASKEFKCPDRIYTRQIAEFSDKYLFPSAYFQGGASSNASSDSSGDASGDALGDVNTSGYASTDTEGDASGDALGDVITSGYATGDTEGDASEDALGDVITSGYASGDTEGDAEECLSNNITITSTAHFTCLHLEQLKEQLLHDSLRPRGPRGPRRAWGSLCPRIIKGVATEPLVLVCPQPSTKRHNREFLQKSRSQRLPGVTKWQRTKNDIGTYYVYMRIMTVVNEARNKECQGISENDLSHTFPNFIAQPPIGTGRKGKYPLINLNLLFDIVYI